MAGYLKHNVTRQDQPDGTIILGSGLDLGPVVRDTNAWLHHWADVEPARVFIAQRSGAGWHSLTYLEMLEATRAVAASLLARGIGRGKPVAVLSGPSLNHAVLMQAAQYVGAPIVPLAEQYSLIPEAHVRLQYCIEKVQPAMVYAEDGTAYGAALDLPCLDGLQKVVGTNPGAGVSEFDALLQGNAGSDLEAAYAAITPDTLAKILFTSGSTSDPKGVPTTQGMLCVNQAQYLASLPFLGVRHHTILDWLPWNHVFAGNSDFNTILSNGGSLYLDGGKPVKGLFEQTLENLKLVNTTLSFNVPIAYSLLVQAMREDAELRSSFFSDLDMIFYAGASLPADIWSALEDMSRAETGRVPMMTSSWGMTETAPASIIHYQGGASSGMIGVPMPEQQAKLIPEQPERYELRVRGPNIMAGYLNDPSKNAEVFDEDGFFITGDAVRFVDPDDVTQGVLFDGRISDEFKLMTGTWVQASRLRLTALSELAGLVQDVVVTGAGKSEIGLLIFATPALGLTGDGNGAVADADYFAKIADVMGRMAEHATGSSNRIVRALVIDGPPSVGDGEITAKGSLNNRTILLRRAALVDRLYDDVDPAVIRV
ncbi:MAG: feruloyl-CoA synthase [Paracoccaceae bacterium]